MINQVVVLSDTQAREIFQDELKKFFSDNPLTIEQDHPKERVVDMDGLIKARPFIGSRSTIYKKVSAGLIPHSKQGKRLIFDLNLIDDWLLSNKIKTVQEIAQETDEYLSRRKRKGVKNE